VLAVVTNVDEDHMDPYGHDVARLDQAFIDFLHRLPFYGAAVVCADDPGVQRLLPRVQRPLVRYGMAEGASPRAVDVQALGGGRMRFTAQRAGLPDLPVTLNLAGLHNVRNALAAIAVADELELPAEVTTRWRCRRCSTPHAAPSPDGAWCSRSSRTATRAPATASTPSSPC
jgi:UDP-N-acetylmuramate--alanine ligase